MLSYALHGLFVFSYSIERTSDLNKYFYIDITSGALMTVQSLDREEMSEHNITVLAMEMSKSPLVLEMHFDMAQIPLMVKRHWGRRNVVLRLQFQTSTPDQSIREPELKPYKCNLFPLFLLLAKRDTQPC